MNETITTGIIAVALVLLVLISIVIITMLLARRQKIAHELLQVQTQNRLLETQFAALRSQMNPHFIFNSLNSIRLFTEQNNGQAASLYLGKFSSLIRHILDHSRAERITLDEEIQSIQLYLELESLRFKQKINHSIHIDQDVDWEFIEIPPMIIQPLIENAILHGLINKPAGGHVSLAISYQNPDQAFIKIVVEDNGIGRRAAVVLKKETDNDRQSYALQIVKERLEMLHKDSVYKENYFETEDLYNPDNSVAGTRVILILPLK